MKDSVPTQTALFAAPLPPTPVGAGDRTPRPLPEVLRPTTWEQFIGQEHLVAPGSPLRMWVEQGPLPSMILWGPPGSGKTSLARLIASQTPFPFVPFSAVTSGIKEVKETLAQAQKTHARYGHPTVVFIDEIHRFNKSQQDAFLPDVEAGSIVLLGATTENPSFALNRALMSRCQLFVLQPFSDDQARILLQRVWPQIFSLPLPEMEALQPLIHHAQGDARRLLGRLEGLAKWVTLKKPQTITAETIAKILDEKSLTYDRHETHYDVTSAFIKSLRGSDPDAALHYLARMLEGGEDPLFICRRMMIFASEDIGNADPRALELAVAASLAFERIGLPEGFIPLAHATTYLACAPKSNAAYRAYLAARADLQTGPTPEVPLHLRNAPTALMREVGYGAGYSSPHDMEDHTHGLNYLPAGLAEKRYYTPSTVGLEGKIRDHLEKLRAQRRG